MAQFRHSTGHLFCALAVLAMASAQGTPLATTINAKVTSVVEASHTVTDTPITAATGTPPFVLSTTITLASTNLASTPSHAPTAAPIAPLNRLSSPAIAGIAAGATVILFTVIALTAFLYIKHRRKAIEQWPDLPTETVYRSVRRPSSAATLVNVPAEVYIPSDGSMKHNSGPVHHSRVSASCEEPAKDFTFNLINPTETSEEGEVPQLHADTLQKLIADKSLPSSPQHELPMPVMLQAAKEGRPGSSICPRQGKARSGPPVTVSLGYF